MMKQEKKAMTVEEFEKLSKWTVVHLTENEYLHADCAYTVKGLKDRIMKVCGNAVRNDDMTRKTNWREITRKIHEDIISHVILGKGNKAYKLGSLFY